MSWIKEVSPISILLRNRTAPQQTPGWVAIQVSFLGMRGNANIFSRIAHTEKEISKRILYGCAA